MVISYFSTLKYQYWYWLHKSSIGRAPLPTSLPCYLNVTQTWYGKRMSSSHDNNSLVFRLYQQWTPMHCMYTAGGRSFTEQTIAETCLAIFLLKMIRLIVCPAAKQQSEQHSGRTASSCVTQRECFDFNVLHAQTSHIVFPAWTRLGPQSPSSSCRLEGRCSFSQNRWRAVKGDASIMEDKPLLPGYLYWLARLLQEEAYYDVRGRSHLVRVWRARTG